MLQCVRMEKLLMVRQYRNALERMTLEIPRRSERQCDRRYQSVSLQRELEEETGYRSENLSFCFHFERRLHFVMNLSMCTLQEI